MLVVRKGAQSPVGREKAWAPGGQVGGSIARWMALGQHVVRRQARPCHSPAGGEGADGHKGVWGEGSLLLAYPPSSSKLLLLGPCLCSSRPLSLQHDPHIQSVIQSENLPPRYLPTPLFSVLISPVFQPGPPQPG